MDLDVIVAPGHSNTSHAVLHPLLLISISDHWTRTNVILQSGTTLEPILPVCGVLLGKIDAHQVEVFTSFEAALNDSEIDPSFFNFKKEQYRQVFPNYDVVGWYAVGTHPTMKDLEIYRSFCNLCEAPLFLQFQPLRMLDDKENIPIAMYETILDSKQQTLFSAVNYHIETNEAERIAVAHMFTQSEAKNESQSIRDIQFLQNQKSAIQVLRSKLETVEEFLKKMKTQDSPSVDDVARLSKIASVLHGLPSILGQNDLNQEILNEEMNLASITNQALNLVSNAYMLNEIQSKLKMTTDHDRTSIAATGKNISRRGSPMQMVRD